MRLAPRDSDIPENLNLVLRKLALPEKYLITSPADVPPYLRDSLRPDEWMLLGAFGIALIFIGSGIWRLTEKKSAVPDSACNGCGPDSIVHSGSAHAVWNPHAPHGCRT